MGNNTLTLLHANNVLNFRFHSLTDKTELLLKELRVSYQNLCKSIIPIPFIGDEQLDVDIIYVEGVLNFKPGLQRW